MKKLFITFLIAIFISTTGMITPEIKAAQGGVGIFTEQKKDDKKKDPPGPPPVKPKGPKSEPEPRPKDKKPGN
ncbi:MAG: hypothetical protein AB1757_15310 [Acidobacteriota bacterium]